MKYTGHLRDLKGRIDQVLREHELGSVTFRPGCAPEELEDLEDAIFGKLPEDYAGFLGETRELSAPEVGRGVRLFPPIVVALGFRDDSTPKRLITTVNGDLTEVWVVPIGTDGGGETVFLLGTSPIGFGRVWRWESGSGEVRFDGAASEGFEPHAESFSSFLAQVEASWNAFLDP